MTQTIADIRKDYKLKSLTEQQVEPNPFHQFNLWWTEAINSNIEEVNAMTLATCDMDNKPTARIVLLKDIVEDEGFVFYTNYQSKKGKQLEQNPYTALVFFWIPLERQIRIEGTASKIEEAASSSYFKSRPLESQIGAWASPQSQVIANRHWLENQEQLYIKKYTQQPIERPKHWGGYIVKPTLIEFWQGRPSRLHDRIQYTYQKDNTWKIERLAP